VILSGILNEQAEEVIAAYRAAGNNLAERTEIGEWTTTVMRKAG
jgi:ribosomal protein L11 methyltransferase